MPFKRCRLSCRYRQFRKRLNEFAVGRLAVLEDLRDNGSPCSNVLVNVAIDNDSSIKTVLVEIECEISRVGLQLLALGRRTIEAKSIEVIDVWRVD